MRPYGLKKFKIWFGCGDHRCSICSQPIPTHREARSRLKQETRIEIHTELTSPEACNQDPCDCSHCIGYTQEQFDAVVLPIKKP